MAHQAQDESMSSCDHYIGIDYSGAQTPEDSLPGLRFFIADGSDKDISLQYSAFCLLPVERLMDLLSKAGIHYFTDHDSGSSPE